MQYRNSQNQLLSTALFIEGGLSPYAVYTLSREDKPGAKSLYKLYMEETDLTEYAFATKCFESYSHWQQVSKLQLVKSHVAEWRAELETRERAKALRRIQEESAGTGKNAVQASKFLVEKGWVDKNSKGRPSKADIAKAADQMARDASDIEELAQRVQ